MPEATGEGRRIFLNDEGLIEVKYDKTPSVSYFYADQEDFLADVRMFIQFAQRLGVEEFDSVVI